MKWKRLSIVIVLLIAIAAAIGGELVTSRKQHTAPQHNARATHTPSPAPRQNAATTISHIFIIIEENETYQSVIGNTSAPYINKLARQYALATNYTAISHPSLPNYLALTSGSTDGITTDCNPPSAGCEVSVPNIADEIEKSGRTWKEYAESMPRNCAMVNAGEYATKHNPFVYYTDIESNSSRCATHVVPYTQLSTDLQSISTTPNFAFISPNLCDGMHDCPIGTGDAWLAKNVPLILQSKAFTTQNSLLVITWDEGNTANNQVPAIFAGSAAKNNYQSATAYNHYSLLHTIESVWDLTPLTNNVSKAPTMNEFLK